MEFRGERYRWIFSLLSNIRMNSWIFLARVSRRLAV